MNYNAGDAFSKVQLTPSPSPFRRLFFFSSLEMLMMQIAAVMDRFRDILARQSLLAF